MASVDIGGFLEGTEMELEFGGNLEEIRGKNFNGSGGSNSKKQVGFGKKELSNDLGKYLMQVKSLS